MTSIFATRRIVNALTYVSINDDLKKRLRSGVHRIGAASVMNHGCKTVSDPIP
jgi:hypothetical protein